MGKRGPIGKPVSDLKLCGTFRKDRHGKRERRPQPSGWPIMPGGMPAAAQRHWADVVPLLQELGLVGSIDTPALEVLCRSWASLVEMQSGPATIHHLNAARRMWHSMAVRFGLDPRAREALLDSLVDDDDDPAAEFVS